MISVGKTPVIMPFNKINDDFLTFGQYDPKYLDAGGANRPPPFFFLILAHLESYANASLCLCRYAPSAQKATKYIYCVKWLDITVSLMILGVFACLCA